MSPRYYLFPVFVIGYGSSFAQMKRNPTAISSVLPLYRVPGWHGRDYRSSRSIWPPVPPECGLSVIACLTTGGTLYGITHRFGDAQAILRKGWQHHLRRFANRLVTIPVNGHSAGCIAQMPKGRCVYCSANWRNDHSIPPLHWTTLSLADTQYNPPWLRQCRRRFPGKIITQAGWYLPQQGRYSQAIQRLLAFVLIDIEVAKNLNHCSGQNYSRAQVNRELDRGIAHIKKMREIKDGEKAITRSLQLWLWSASESIWPPKTT